MQRTDDLNVEIGGFFQQVLHLCAVFSDDADVVAPCFTRPVLFNVQCAELSEAVSGEEHLVGAVIGHHYFRPVNHWSRHKVQRMSAQLQCVAFLYHDLSVLKGGAEEVLHHGKRLGGGHDNSLGEVGHKVLDVGGVIGLHMLYDKVIGLFAVENVVQIVQPFLSKSAVNGIHYRDLIVHNDIGIVRHTVRNDILTLKKIDLVVVYADIADVFCYVHECIPPILLVVLIIS